MLLAITQNPHTQKPEQLWKTLNDEDSPYYKEEELDKAGFEILKSRIADNPRIKVK